MVATFVSVAGSANAVTEPTRWHLNENNAAWFQVDRDMYHGNDSVNSIRGHIEFTDDNVVDFGDGYASTRMASLSTPGSTRTIQAALSGTRVWKQSEAGLTLVDPVSNATWSFTAALAT